MQTKPALAFLIACLLANAFAQESPPKLAVYVSGARDSSINKSLENKLLAAFAQSGRYVAQIAGQNDADFVCQVSIAEAFGVYSILANMIETANSRVAKTGSVDSPLDSFEELAKASDELARQFLQPDSYVPPLLPLPLIANAQAIAPFQDTTHLSAIAAAPVAAAPKQCERTYNINELLFKVKDGFPKQLKDCASKLAKDMLTPASLGGKKLEPKSFMMQCPVDGIKNELPDGFPGADRLIGSLANFVQVLLNSAMAGGGLDPKKLVSAVASMDINGLLSDIKNLASGECMVNEPYEPPDVPDGEREGGAENGKDERTVYFGIRTGINFSHVYMEYNYRYYNGSYYNYIRRSGTYNDILGMQLGFVLDIATTDWLRIQPGLMYMQKGMEDEYGGITAHYLEIPVLLSLKLSAFRLNAGPYFGLCLTATDYEAVFDPLIFDFGLSIGLGFDIGMFYIGMFYDYGLYDVSSVNGNKRGYDFYNRTLGFNLGVNL